MTKEEAAQLIRMNFTLYKLGSKPLTDEVLMDILNAKGYHIARRTVAKYREMLGIPVARLRKQL